ncbi:MAG: Mth938-like domain-containing protein [Pseudomonadota bacterium]
MKLHATATQQYQTVTAYDDVSIEINAKSFRHSLIVLPEVAPVAWPVASFELLQAEHFAQIEAYVPDVVIFGTGARQRFVHPKLISALSARHVGVECMDNKAACRTYNILMAEGRKVALALIIEADVKSVANANHDNPTKDLS